MIDNLSEEEAAEIELESAAIAATEAKIAAAELAEAQRLEAIDARAEWNDRWGCADERW